LVTPAKTRQDFQRIAQDRIAEAGILLNNGKWDGAYYIAGYSVECALKSCIIKKLMATDAFPDKKFSENCYKHDLTALLRLAGLEDDLNSVVPLAAKWAIVKLWSEQSRYEIGRDEPIVREFLNAIIDPSEGVFPWIQLRW
jgi:HEPN domain-containing protein